MTRRRNEEQSMMRAEPFGYICSYDANNFPIYEAWSEPGFALTATKWIVCKHTYDTNGNLTRTQWVRDSSGAVADFSNAIGADDTTPSFTSLTFV